MEIRAARDDDFDAITSITNHYIETSTIHFAYEPLPAGAIHALWRASSDRFPWLVADIAGAIAGYAKAGTWRDRAAYDWTAEVGLYVRPDAHRRGLGRALYGELLAELARRGFRSAIAGITLPNEASLALHRAFGFEPVGTVRDAGWKHGRWCDVAFWQKRLATGPEGPGGGQRGGAASSSAS
jgi:phosphinothricin acetyltransferase